MGAKQFPIVFVLLCLLTLPVNEKGDGRAEEKLSIWQTITIERVSESTDGTQGNYNSGEYWGFISANGRYVAFGSKATNLVNNDTNNATDIFVRDRLTGSTERVSIASDGTQANNFSTGIAISFDGRFVAFSSFASNLISDDTNGGIDVFVHDRQTGETTRVSVASDGTQHNGSLYTLVNSISSDGRYVVFHSDATNLVTGDDNDANDVFLHDRQTGQTTRISLANDGTQGNDDSFNGRISANGRYVVFTSGANNLVQGDTNGTGDIFVHDLQTGQTRRVSVSSDGTEGNNNSGNDGCGSGPNISSDGKYVVFVSSASNLVAGDTNERNDVFVHDMQSRQTVRTSIASDGIQGDGHSGRCRPPTISADGRFVAFVSEASNLVPSDTNGVWDVFVVELGGGAPSLDLPFDYPSRGSDSGFAGVLFRSAFIARTNSVFDHDLPNNITNAVTLPYLGYSASTYPNTRFPCGPPNYECYDGHDGYDFKIVLNTPVLASAAGTVTWGYDSANKFFCSATGTWTRGCMATIDHGNGYQTQYLHLQQLGGSDNDPICRTGTGFVNDTEIIGNVGMTGCTTGPHIHFEVLHNDIVVDPSGWLESANDPWEQESNGSGSFRLWRYVVPWQELWLIDGQDGGSFTSSSGTTTIDVQPGAFSGLWDFTLTDAPVAEPSATLKSTGRSFLLNISQSQLFDNYVRTTIETVPDLEATAATTLTLPLTITIRYTDTEIVDLDESTLRLYWWDEQGSAWTPLTTTLDMVGDTAVANTDVLGLFALLIDDNDLEGPTIDQPVFISTVASNEWLIITAPISDTLTGNHGVSEATLYYSYTPPYTQTTVLGVRPSGMGDGIWTFEIPPQGPLWEGATLKFSIEAEDGDLSPVSSVNDNDSNYFTVKIMAQDDPATTPTLPPIPETGDNDIYLPIIER